jgi:hypothetical protein
MNTSTTLRRHPLFSIPHLPSSILHLRFLVLCLFTSAIATGQTSQPAQFDLTTPKGSLKAFTTALDAGDAGTMRKLLSATTPTEKRMADATIDFAVAIADLNHAMEHRFGREEAQAALPQSSQDLNQSLGFIDKAEEKVDGDSAVVSNTPGTAPSTIMLKKVDGIWKISLADQANSTSPKQLDETLTMLTTQCRLMREVTADVKAGKFATASDAASSVRGKLTGTSQPSATQPTE